MIEPVDNAATRGARATAERTHASMRANERQVGGRHYKTAFEHWDLVLETGMGYLEGCATKYVARWRSKNGQVDLDKAVHYVDKLQETAHLVSQPRQLPRHPAAIDATVHRFAQVNRLTPLEERIVRDLACWQYAINLVGIADMIRRLAAEPLPDPAPVPLTEENHHAERDDRRAPS